MISIESDPIDPTVWFKEGMAYALSEDPRQDMAEPMQGYRDRFIKWYRVTGKDRLWEVAKAL